MYNLAQPSSITLNLGGSLATKFDREFKLSANRLSEVITFCYYQLDGFSELTSELDQAGSLAYIEVAQGDSKILVNDPIWLEMELLPDAIVTIADIPIAGGETFTKIATGIGLLAFAALVPGGFLGITAQSIAMYGTGLVLGGIVNWLSPKQTQKNSVIGGIQTDRTEGKPIPVVYGRSWVTPVTISSGVRIVTNNEIKTDGAWIGAAYWRTYVSTSYMSFVDAICEGPIKGFATTIPEQSMWLNNNPVKNSVGNLADLTGLFSNPVNIFNFSNTFDGIEAISWRFGEANQAPLNNPNPLQVSDISLYNFESLSTTPGWNNIEREVAVGSELRQGYGYIIRKIDEENISQIKVRLYWPQLSDDDGARSTYSPWAIYIKEGNGEFILREVNQIDGKSGGYEQLSVFSVGQAPYYEVKVQRNKYTPDPNDPNNRDVMTWASYSVVWNVQMRYKYTAIIAWNFNVKKFGTNQISRKYLIDGMICSIPSNASVRSDGALAYSGVWDGTFIDQWTSCPCWCLWNLLSNNRFGLGVPTKLLDKFAFYAGSVYCNQLINNGFGATEPRFALNCTISTRSEAFNLIRQICNVFNAMSYYAPGGGFMPVLDKPQPVTAQFNNSDSTFSYSGTPVRSRYNRISVSYQFLERPDQVYREIWEDEASISKNGANESRDEGFGIASRGQARRAANWLGYTTQIQTESITISTGTKGANIRPGQVIQVSDWLKTQTRLAGRIATADLQTITLDQPITLALGNHTLYFELPDGTIKQRTIGSIGETRQTWTVTPNFTTIPKSEAAWIISANANPPTQWRVISVVEPELHKYEILALIHDPAKFDLIELLDFVPPSLPQSAPVPPLPPSTLIATKSGNNIIVSWSPPSPSNYTASYQFEWQNSTLPPQISSTVATSALISSVTPDCKVSDGLSPLFNLFHMVCHNGLNTIFQPLHCQ